MTSRPGSVLLAETIEDIREEFGRNPLSVVAHADLDVGVDAFENDRDATSLGSKFYRVGEKIPKHLLQPGRIAGHRLHGVEHLDDAHLFGGSGGKHTAEGGFDDGREVDRLNIEPGFAGNDTAHLEQILDDTGLGARVALDRFETFLDGGRVVPAGAQ